MDPKTVVVNFKYISAYQALANIVEQCGKESVLQAIDEINSSEIEGLPPTLMGFPVVEVEVDPPVVLGSFNDYDFRLKEK